MIAAAILHGASLAAPSIGSDRVAITDYVLRIVRWSELVFTESFPVAISDRAGECLFRDDLYPIRPKLRELFLHKGIVEFDANTVAMVLETLLSRVQKLSDVTGIVDLLVDELDIEPAFPDCPGLMTREDVERCIVICVLASRCLNAPIVIAGTANCTNASLRVRGVLHDLELTERARFVAPRTPEAFAGDVVAVDSLTDCYAAIDTGALLRDPTAEAVQLALCAELHVLAATRRPFRFGRDFCQDLRKAISQVGTEKVLRALAETVLRVRLSDVHHLRENRGANAPQVQRGEDRAWRRDVDREYHLHYWECLDGAVEFANIVTHNIFEITR